MASSKLVILRKKPFAKQRADDEGPMHFASAYIDLAIQH
jgi:hypothetical protein